MRERAINMHETEVRAILEGRKTQTRRVVQLSDDMFDSVTPMIGLRDEKRFWRFAFSVDGATQTEDVLCPHGTVGDRLWVREAWAPAEAALPLLPGVLYRADYHTGLEKRDGDEKWRPSIHMPRWASRITLEITGVRVERLQEISERDARSEGVDTMRDMRFAAPLGNLHSGACRLNFIDLWQSINGPESWSANPWVWVVEFKVV